MSTILIIVLVFASLWALDKLSNLPALHRWQGNRMVKRWEAEAEKNQKGQP